MDFKFLRVPVLITVVLASAACSDDQNPAASSARRDASAPRATAQEPRTIDDDFADTSTDVPGFGGIYVGGDGTLTARLTDLKQAGAARSAVAKLLVRHGRGENASAVASMRFEKGEYSFGELKRWYNSLRRERIAGVLSGDINERRNRIVIGVGDTGSVDGVKERVRALGINPDAVVVEVHEPTVSAASLMDVVRPVVGGVQIAGPGYYCTLGYNVQRYDANGYPDGQRYFITNSHCTDAFGTLTGMVLGQPTTDSPIADEVVDPALRDEFGGCPGGRTCRYSDAALFRYTPGVSSSFLEVANVGAGTSGSATIINTRIMNDERFAYIGDDVGKVGRTTGYSNGAVAETCVDIAQYEDGGGYLYDTGRTMMCQTRVNGMRVQGGDSGSPAYHREGSSTRWAVGIVWGGNSSSGVYSTIYHALREFRETDGGFFVVAQNGFFKP